jgi:glutamate-1-semialdehyde 2,1-aminomutase
MGAIMPSSDYDKQVTDKPHANLAMTGTFSKSPLAWGLPAGLAVTHAHGSMVKLNDEKWYHDWPCALGPNLLGYGQTNEPWYNAVKEQLKDGAAYSLPSALEAEAAELLCNMLVDWQGHECTAVAKLQVRFCKTGTEANQIAVKLARGVTGKHGIIAMEGGYHGWADWSQADEKPGHGVTPSEGNYLARAKFNDSRSLSEAASRLWDRGKVKVAAVIIEQPLEPPEPDYYDNVKRFCQTHGALLIMDEVVTGLRYGGGGASGYYGIRPDIVTMGKGLGNGVPIGAVVGHKSLMYWFARQNPVFASSTFWGEALGLAAAIAVINQWDTGTVKRLQDLNEQIQAAFDDAGWQTKGDMARSLVVPTNDSEHAFMIQGFLDEAHLVNRPNFACLAQADVGGIEALREAARVVRAKYIAALERGVLAELVQGKFPRPLFVNR